MATTTTTDPRAALTPRAVRDALSRCYPHGLVALACDQVTVYQGLTGRYGWQPAPWWRDYAPGTEPDGTPDAA